MPIYEYKCESCNNVIEKLQKLSDEPLVKCGRCKELKLVKQISNTSFKLKGSGWFNSGGY